VANTYDILVGDCIASMKGLTADSIDCVVTSPPYFNQRDYGIDGQLGMEATPEEFVENLVSVFSEVKRVLKPEGTVWLNIGDSYAGRVLGDIKVKEVIGIPWMVAFALRRDGWYLRQDIIWHKPNAMPQAVKDRCTSAHEYVFLLTKSPKYFFDAKAIEEPAKWERWGNQTEKKTHQGTASHLGGKTIEELPIRDKKNKRSVWSIPTKGYSGAHCAPYPVTLVEPCLLAGCPVGGTVLDPFGGAGTTAVAALTHKRNAILCEINPAFAKIATDRIEETLKTVNPPKLFDE
jgi:DNA modification methylase